VRDRSLALAVRWLTAGVFVFVAWGQTTVAPAPIPEAPSTYKELRFPPLKEIPVPKVATYTLPNGMKVYLLEDHELPIIRGAARIRTGNLFEPADKIGLAGIMGTVLRSGGTKEKTGDQLDEELENIAASVESDIGEDAGTVTFSTLKENAPEVMGVFKDVLTQPEFRQEKIDLAKTEIRSGIARRNDDAHGIAEREFSDIVYGKDTPYGWRTEYATIDPITRDDLVGFYQRYYFPANVLLAVWGDFSTEDMEAQLTKLFAGWNAQQLKVPPFPPVMEKAHAGIYVADKADVTQTFIEEGHLGGELKDKDYPALEVMGDILGGGFQSRLMQRVRAQLGLVYDISASWGAHYDHPGLFRVDGSTKSVSTAETLKAIQEQIARIRASEVTADELETARQSALNSLVFAFDTRAKTLGRMLTYEYFGYPQDSLERYQKGLEQVTRTDVLRVAKEHVRPQDLTIVAVGKTDEFVKSLATLGLPVSTIDLTIPEAKSERKQGAADPEKGKEVLARVQQAVGGADTLAAVKDMVEVVEYRTAPSAGGALIKRTDRWIAPSTFREETQLPFGVISIYADDQGGWTASPQGSGPLGPEQLKPVRDKLVRLYVPMLLSDRLAGRSVSWSDGALEISAGDNTVRLYVDEKTGLPAKVEYKSPQMGGGASSVAETFDSFEEVSGIKAPKHMTVSQDGHKFAEVTVESLQFNSGLKAEELSKKP